MQLVIQIKKTVEAITSLIGGSGESKPNRSTLPVHKIKGLILDHVCTVQHPEDGTQQLERSLGLSPLLLMWGYSYLRYMYAVKGELELTITPETLGL